MQMLHQERAKTEQQLRLQFDVSLGASSHDTSMRLMLVKQHPTLHARTNTHTHACNLRMEQQTARLQLAETS